MKMPSTMTVKITTSVYRYSSPQVGQTTLRSSSNTSRRKRPAPPSDVGSVRFLAVTAMLLLGLLVRRVLVAPPAVLAELQAVRVVLLVFQGGVVAAFADAAGEGDDVFHGWLFGWGAEIKKPRFPRRCQ